MPYKINYTPEDAHRYPQSQKKRTINWLRYSVFALLLLEALWVNMKGVPDFMIPGDPDITRMATETMISDVKAGEPLEDAVVAFCRTVLDGAEE